MSVYDANPQAKPKKLGAPKVAKPRKLTKTEQKELKQKQEDAFVVGITNNLSAMLANDANYQNSSIERKQEIQQEYLTNQWAPYLETITDVNLRDRVSLAAQGVFGSSINASQVQIDDSSRLSDAGKGIAQVTRSKISGITDVLPIQIATAARDAYLAEYRQLQVMLAEETDPEKIDRLNAEIDLRRNRLENTTGSINKNIDDINEVWAKNAASEEAKSFAYKNRMKRTQELTEEGKSLPGTRANFSQGVISGVANTLTDFAPVVADVGLTVGVSAAGSAVGIPPLLTGSLMMGGMSGAQAGAEAFQATYNAPDLSQSDEYNKLIEDGFTPSDARMRVALNASEQAAYQSGAINAVLNNYGVVGQFNTIVAKEVAKKSLVKSAAKIGAVSTVEAGINALDTLALNYAVGETVGTDYDLWKGVDDAALQGAIFGGVMSSVGTLAGATKSNTETTGKGSDFAGIETGEAVGATPNQSPNDPTQIKRTTTEFDNFSRKFLDVDRLVEKDIETIHQRMENARIIGVSDDVLLAMEQKYLLPREDYVPYKYEDLSKPVETIAEPMSEFNIIDGQHTKSDAIAIQEMLVAKTEANSRYNTSITERDIVSKTTNLNETITNVRSKTKGKNVSEGNLDAIASSAMPVYQLSKATWATMENAINSIDGSNKSSPNSLFKRVTRILKTVEDKAMEEAGVELTSMANEIMNQDRSAINDGPANDVDGARIGAEINSELGTAEPTAFETIVTTAAIETARNNTAVESGGLGGTTISDAGTSQTNARPTQTVGGGGPQPSRVGGQLGGPITQNGARQSTSLRSPRSEGPQPTNGSRSSGTASSISVARAKITNAITGQLDINITPNGRDMSKLPDLTRAIRNNPLSSETALRSAQAIDTIVSIINDLTNKIREYPPNSPEYRMVLNEILSAKDVLDSITDNLAKSGMPEMAPQYISGEGMAKVSIAAESLSANEKVVLQEAYQAAPEYTSTTKFLNDMVADAFNLLVGKPVSATYNALSVAAKSVIAKIAAVLSAGIVTVSLLTNTVPMTDFLSHVGYTAIEAPAPTKLIPTISNDANALVSFVEATADHDNKPYLIADKKSGVIHVMSADHKVIKSSSALYGRESGDSMGVGKTPSGAFTIKITKAPQSYGGDIAQFASIKEGEYSVHRMINVKGQERGKRIASTDPSVKRISDGCVNVPPEFYNAYISKGEVHKIYVLPEEQTVADTFYTEAYNKMRAEQVNLYQQVGDVVGARGTAYLSSDTAQASTDPLAAARANVATQSAETIGKNYSSVDADNSDTSILLGLAGLFGGSLAVARVASTRKRKLGEKPTNLETPIVREVGTPDVLEQTPANVIDESLGSVVVSKDTILNADLGGVPLSVVDKMFLWGKRVFVDKTGAEVMRFLQETIGRGNNIPHIEQHPINMAVATARNKREFINQDLTKKYITPFIETAKALSTDLNMDFKMVVKYLGSWASLRHIPEANAALREGLVERYARAREAFNNNVDTTMDHAILTEMNEARFAIEAFDRSQESGIIEEGVRLASGMTDKAVGTARDFILSQGIPLEKAESASQSLIDGFSGALDLLVESGVVPESEAAVWRAKNFKNFVSLYVDQPNTVNDLTFSQHREGTNKIADNAFETLSEYIDKAAYNIARRDVAIEFSKLHRQLTEAGMDSPMELVRTSQLGEEHSFRKGFYFTEEVEANGAKQPIKYKLMLNDEGLNAVLFPDNGSYNRTGFKERLTQANRLVAKSVTQYVPSFPVINMMRDLPERAIIAMTRHFNDTSGKQVNATLIGLQILNPMRNTLVANAAFQGIILDNYSGKYGEYLLELRKEGGLSTFSDMAFRDKSRLAKSVDNKTGVRGAAHNVDSAVRQYNEVFNTVAPLSMYAAMRDAGVDAKTASFLVLDSMNFSTRGKLTESLGMFAPFVNSAFQSGGNVLKSFGLGYGENFFSAGNMKNLAKIGGFTLLASVTAGAIRASLGQDENGEYVMDKMPLRDLRSMIPLALKGEDGKVSETYGKFFVGFGTPQLMWTWGIMLDRMDRGVADAEDFFAESASTFIANGVIDPTPGFKFSENPVKFLTYSSLPAAIKQFYLVGSNMTYYGGSMYGEQNYKSKLNKDSGRQGTPSVYKDMANSLYELTGVDMHPEAVRGVAQGIFLGSAGAILKVGESQSTYYNPTPKTTPGEMSPVIHALGINRFYGNNYRVDLNRFYSATNKMEDILIKRGVPLQDRAYSGGDGSKKLAMIRERMIAKQFTPSQISTVMSLIEFEKVQSKLDREMKARVKNIMATPHYSDESLQKLYDEYADANRIQLMQFFSNYNPKEWR